jgi:hypothetical protein
MDQNDTRAIMTNVGLVNRYGATSQGFRQGPGRRRAGALRVLVGHLALGSSWGPTSSRGTASSPSRPSRSRPGSSRTTHLQRTAHTERLWGVVQSAGGSACLTETGWARLRSLTPVRGQNSEGCGGKRGAWVEVEAVRGSKREIVASSRWHTSRCHAGRGELESFAKYKASIEGSACWCCSAPLANGQQTRTHQRHAT